MKRRRLNPATAAKFRDAAFLLPILGLLLLFPPIIDLFAAPSLLGGIPMIVVYIFGLWLALVVVAFWFSRRLSDDESGTGAAPPVETPERQGE